MCDKLLPENIHYFVSNGHYRAECFVCALPRLVADSALQIIKPLIVRTDKALSDEMFET